MANRRANPEPFTEVTENAQLFADERVRVLLPLPLGEAYDYALPPGMTVEAGSIVEVPLGQRRVTGVVWDATPAGGKVAAEKLKPVIRVFDVPPLPEVGRRFVDWVAAYYLAEPGTVLKMSLSAPAALEPPVPTVGYLRGEGDPEALGLRLTPARRRVLSVLADGPPRPAAELAREAGVSAGVIKGLADAGVLERVAMYDAPGFEVPADAPEGPALSESQAAAARSLSAKVRDGFSVTLIDGVTGSGKTEVYFEAVKAALRQGRQVLVLLPEIALSAQWLERFAARFGVAPAVWHSECTQAQRRATWRAVARGEAPVVVGARSALFLPYPDLGLVVVDEEHDQAFKQEDGVPYHARDMAVVRARLGGFPAVLVSATPSLESLENVRAGRYDSVHLPERHAGAQLPDIEAIDMRADRPPPIQGHGQSFIAPSLRDAVGETLAAGEQALLFLNRRGYAPLTLCRACGHRLQCPNCTAWLVEHRLVDSLQCHHCGYMARVPQSCPECGAEHSFAACGPGVERLHEEVKALFPEARVALMASDTVTGPAAAARFIESVQNREIDLLIGTQIVAKGNHFPYLTLVGVVDADLGLAGGDLRAGERTYQLLHQVAGRAGRAERPGRVMLQTYEPVHEVIQALVSGDRDRFLAVEAENRRKAGMPPFARLAALILSSPDEAAVDAVARALARAAPQGEGIEVMGPAPAPLAILRGRHRRRMLLRTRRDIAPQPLLRDWLRQVEVPGKVRLSVDVDPYHFL
ncbi:primosomal protein N' [Ferruginivarius sediminum]|uniref:Replication restart protein PriA n=1 Tax=Ferruginivarius sediminum TaxID=2661937 RepID=A0A369TED6_9PROT|nr:primosomal protein N' [Ferruginivarius sediminum]RDD62924.1 primosomal protein N' [Ferruginivarius sediminum]